MSLKINKKIIKFFVNIALGIIPSSKKRKGLREKWINFLTDKNDDAKYLFKDLNNKLIIVNENGQEIEESSVDGLILNFMGKNSIVKIHEPVKFTNCYFELKDNCEIEIKTTIYSINNLTLLTSINSKIFIDNNFSCNKCVIVNLDESEKIVQIGKDCMFSWDITIRVSDGHTIYNLGNNEPINTPQKGIFIGNHVWIGMEAIILKDVHIPNNTVIGAKSLVNKSYIKENTILAGVPAKVIKENINWARENTDNYIY